MRSSPLLAAAVLTASAPASAADPPPTLTLDAALAAARARHPALLAGMARVRAVEAEADVARAAWLPTMSVVAELVGSTTNNSTATFLSSPFVDLPRIGATPILADPSAIPYPSTLLALGVRQPLWDFGRVGAQVSLVRAQVRVERARSDGLGLEVDLGVRQSFVSVLAAKQLLRAADEALERSRVRRDFALAAVAKGAAPEIDATRAEADVERARLGRLRAAGALDVARASLASAVGGREAALDAAEPAAAAPAEVPSPDALVAAVERDPVVEELRARAEAARAFVRVLEASRMPSLFLSGSLSLRSGGAPPSSGPAPFADGWVPSVPNASLGIVLNVPILDFPTDARVRAAKLQERALALEADAMVHRLRGAARVAATGAALAAGALPALDATLEAAARNQVLAERRMREGLGTQTERADAEAIRVEAEVQRVLGALELERTRALLLRLRGGAR